MSQDDRALSSTDVKVLEQIQELNLNALLLAQSVLKSDIKEGMLRFGLESSTAQFLLGLSFKHIQRLSKTPHLLFPIKLDHKYITDILLKDDDVSKSMVHLMVSNAAGRLKGNL